MEKDFLATSRRDGDVLKLMSLVLEGNRSQVEAGRLLGLSTRQVRRIEGRLARKGDSGVVHRLGGKPSNRRLDPSVRQKALAMYRKELIVFWLPKTW